MLDLLSHWEATLIAITFVSLVGLEFALGVHHQKPRKTDHWWIDFASLIQLALFIKPLIFLSIAGALFYLVPQWQGVLAQTPFWIGLLIVFLPDDFLHYWYHRLAHENDWMWPWHRTHHSTPSYHTSIAFRENWTWFFFMPGIWWSGAMVYLGLAEQVAISTAIIGLHNIVIHSGLQVDIKLYRSKFGKQFMRVFEHFIQTPSLHRAHHGLGNNAAPMGNYGQTLFIWDVIFGTANFVEDQLPERYGVLKGGDEPWYLQLWFPYAYKKSQRNRWKLSCC